MRIMEFVQCLFLFCAFQLWGGIDCCRILCRSAISQLRSATEIGAPPIGIIVLCAMSICLLHLSALGWSWLLQKNFSQVRNFLLKRLRPYCLRCCVCCISQWQNIASLVSLLLQSFVVQLLVVCSVRHQHAIPCNISTETAPTFVFPFCRCPCWRVPPWEKWSCNHLSSSCTRSRTRTMHECIAHIEAHVRTHVGTRKQAFAHTQACVRT